MKKLLPGATLFMVTEPLSTLIGVEAGKNKRRVRNTNYQGGVIMKKITFFFVIGIFFFTTSSFSFGQSIYGTGRNQGSGWMSNGAGGFNGTGRNQGLGWMSNGAGGFNGTGRNQGSGWMSNGAGGFNGTGRNQGLGWMSNGFGR